MWCHKIPPGRTGHLVPRVRTDHPEHWVRGVGVVNAPANMVDDGYQRWLIDTNTNTPIAVIKYLSELERTALPAARNNTVHGSLQ